jgi:hypothetical protein
MNFISKRRQFIEKNALRVRVGIFILFSSPSLSHSLHWPSLSTDSTSRPSLYRHLFLSNSLYLAILMFYLYHLMFYLNLFFYIYVLLNFFFYIFLYVVLNFVFICCVCVCVCVFVFFFKLTSYELMI